MKSQLKDYFHFNNTERKGIITLIVLIVLVIIAKQSLIYFSPVIEHDEIAINKIKSQLDSIQKAEKRLEKNKNNITFSKSERSSEQLNIPSSNFNPNDLSLNDWQSFGLSEKQAQVILNYKEKSGGFKSKAQVKKMFVISDELYSELKPFIDLPDTLQYKKYKDKNIQKNNYFKRDTIYPKRRQWKPRVYKKVFINTADTAQFKSLYGIGEVLAERIVKRRTELGGFRSKEQLKEIYGLKVETLLKLDSLLIFDEIPLNKLSINKATTEELKAHPYIFWKQANSIVKYRKMHGIYFELEDIKKSILITDSIYERIEPYLKL